ncbi:MAG: Na+/H+ antiporter NhaA [Desulfobulbaceae bacterium]|nr:MAG: Na+/H+ antiporter NhaA [Desulfobulbaceae bacterium]
MAASEYKDQTVEAGRFEKAFKQALSPLEDFVHRETSSGIILMSCVIVSIVIANSPLFTIYDSILHTKLTVGVPGLSLSHSLHHWINDGLMALFFFVVGLEVKREILIGELSNLKGAILPIGMAIGGMVVPASCYLIFNHTGEATNGWGIPMATDIAFALGILALLGSRIPKTLIALLLAIAIVDDIGAVLVIAVFYTDTIHYIALVAAGIFFVILVLANLGGVRSPIPYVIFGLAMWVAMFESGVHATLAGILVAFTIPARSAANSFMFANRMKTLSGDYQAQILGSEQQTGDVKLNVLRNNQKQIILQSMENAVNSMESPLQRLEHGLHSWVAFLIVPIFALANAGIPIEVAALPTILSSPVTLGIMSGLVIGKVVGIYGAYLIITKFGISKLPAGVNPLQVLGISLLAGIGFTMSIFIGTLAFEYQPEYLLNAKIGIVCASLVAGVVGYVVLFKASRTTSQSLND